MRIQVSLGSVLDVRADAAVRITRDGVGRRSDPVLDAAGPAVRDELRAWRAAASQQLDVGDVVVTGAGALPATWLIHVRAPTYDLSRNHAHLLAHTYRSVLSAADGVLAATVVMPALGTSVTYWPLEEAARVASTTLRGCDTRVTTLTLLLPSAAGLEPFAEALARG